MGELTSRAVPCTCLNAQGATCACGTTRRYTAGHAVSHVPTGRVVLILHAARGPSSDTQYQFELENQAGQALSLAPAAREALVTGLALHDRAQRSVEQARAP